MCCGKNHFTITSYSDLKVVLSKCHWLTFKPCLLEMVVYDDVTGINYLAILSILTGYQNNETYSRFHLKLITG